MGILSNQSPSIVGKRIPYTMKKDNRLKNERQNLNLFAMLAAGDGTREGCRRLKCADQVCFPGVDCDDTRSGPRCGTCPPGYTGMQFLYIVPLGPWNSKTLVFFFFFFFGGGGGVGWLVGRSSRQTCHTPWI